MDPEDASVRNFKDFLLIYNKMAELCFNHCVYNMNQRDLTTEEVDCVNKCASKSIHINHKLMSIYMEVQPEIVNKRIEEANLQAQLANEQQTFQT
ncbi:mitochondrial import inner membrane translocase subunit Tim10 B [Centruroides vittatus]|uniref:mitochondrial import inner membrane translocase subunit Tim10 B n=1 Tax=Centruroides vittatus TaxID=120091 RepID=UPI00350EF34D